MFSYSLLLQEIYYRLIKLRWMFICNKVIAADEHKSGIWYACRNQPRMFFFNHILSPGNDQRLCLYFHKLLRLDIRLIHHQTKHFSVSLSGVAFLRESLRQLISDLNRQLRSLLYTICIQICAVQYQSVYTAGILKSKDHSNIPAI